MRVLVLGIPGLVFALALAMPVFAHGNQFRDPRSGDLVPPGLRLPQDAEPPPPPPPIVYTPLDQRVPKPLPGDDWFFWWEMNSPRFENVKWNLYHRMGSSPLFISEKEERARWRRLRGGEYRVTVKVMEELGLPALFKVVEGETPADAHAQAAAFRALGKTVRTDADARRLLAAAKAVEGPGFAVHEASLLALGLLRCANPEDRFPGALLDEVRTLLLRELGMDRRMGRVRAAAALAYGMLADQPYVGPPFPSSGVDELLGVLERSGGDEEPGSSILIALGLHPPGAVGSAVLSRVRRMALEGKRPRGRVHSRVRSEAIRTLGRIGGLSEVVCLQEILAGDAAGPHDRRAAVIALTLMAERFPEDDTQGIPAILLHAAISAEEADARGFAMLGLARWYTTRMRKEVAPGSWEDLIAHFLRRRLHEGHDAERGYAALALGEMAREVRDDFKIEPHGAMRDRGLAVLRLVLDAEANSDRARAAAAIALGMARHSRSRGRLLEVAQSASESTEVRAAAAWALGLIGEPTSTVARTLGAFVEGQDPWLRRRGVRALALLGQPYIPGRKTDAVVLLLDDLERETTEVRCVDTIGLLARFADHRAVEPLVKIMEDREQSSLVRALAASALGAVGDLEYLGSFDLMREDVNYRARTTFLRDVYRYP